MTAMIGTGLIATPTANVRISLMPCPIPLDSYSGSLTTNGNYL